MRYFLRKAICLLLFGLCQLSTYANDPWSSDFSPSTWFKGGAAKGESSNETIEPLATPIEDAWWLPLVLACLYMGYKGWQKNRKTITE